MPWGACPQISPSFSWAAVLQASKNAGTIVGRYGPVHFSDGVADFLFDLLFSDNSGVIRPLFLTTAEKKTQENGTHGKPLRA